MSKKLRVVNLGISSFYDALTSQDCKAAQIDWRPPVKISDEMQRMLALTLEGDLGAKIDAANEAAADMVIQADPAWVDVKLAGEVIEGLDDYTVTHSGPPSTLRIWSCSTSGAWSPPACSRAGPRPRRRPWS